MPLRLKNFLTAEELSMSEPAFRLREIHQLKTLPPFFDHVLSGKKTFEVRKDDRGFHHDDILDLREWTGAAYTGRRICKRVCYLLSGDAFGVAKDHVVMGLADVPDWADGDYGEEEPEGQQCVYTVVNDPNDFGHSQSDRGTEHD